MVMMALENLETHFHSHQQTRTNKLGNPSSAGSIMTFMTAKNKWKESLLFCFCNGSLHLFQISNERKKERKKEDSSTQDH
jgi:hypothetical protein